MITIERCPCGDCETYGLSDGTFFQGSGWPKELAQRHADCFNAMDGIEDPFEFMRQVAYLLEAARGVVTLEHGHLPLREAIESFGDFQ